MQIVFEFDTIFQSLLIQELDLWIYLFLVWQNVPPRNRNNFRIYGVNCPMIDSIFQLKTNLRGVRKGSEPGEASHNGLTFFFNLRPAR